VFNRHFQQYVGCKVADALLHYMENTYFTNQ